LTLLDSSIWHGKAYSGGWTEPGGGQAAVIEPATGTELGRASGTGARFGGSANLDAFTDTRWVTIRGDIAPYPF
jgi:hypothetical protein